MTNARRWFWRALGWSGAILVALVGLPLLALMVLLLRNVLVPLAALAMVGAVVAYCVNGGFRCWAHRAVRGEEVHRSAAT
ncbi:MAG TPA: hypothetical protein VLA36_09145 [Longimicrobiales bacterium]|nr:hypothetical protein [Longimicrobiales bacterium]